MPISNDRVLSKMEIDKRDVTDMPDNSQLLKVPIHYCCVPDFVT